MQEKSQGKYHLYRHFQSSIRASILIADEQKQLSRSRCNRFQVQVRLA